MIPTRTRRKIYTSLYRTNLYKEDSIMDDLLVNLRNNIRILRTAAGETQAGLGRVLFVDRKTVSSYESGRTVPDLLTLIRIADHYDISVDDLLRKEINM